MISPQKTGTVVTDWCPTLWQKTGASLGPEGPTERRLWPIKLPELVFNSAGLDSMRGSWFAPDRLAYTP